MEHTETGGFLVGTTQGVDSQATQLLDFVLGRSEPPRGNGNEEYNESLHTDVRETTRTSSCDNEFKEVAINSVHRDGSISPQKPILGDSCSSWPQSKAPLTPSKNLGGSKKPQDPSPIKSAELTTHDRRRPPPYVTSTPIKQQRPPKRTSSPSFHPSQDSFAGTPKSQNPEYILATAKQFTIPLDQLGLPHLQKKSSAPASIVDAPSMLPRRLGNSFGLSLAHENTEAHQSSSDDSLQILVASSGLSQSQSDSQKSNESQSFSQQLNGLLASAKSRSTISTDDHIAITGSSTGRVIIGNSAGADIGQFNSQEPTQPTQPTQPAEEDPFLARRRRQPNARTVPATATTATSSSIVDLDSLARKVAAPSHCPVGDNSALLSEASHVANAGSENKPSELSRKEMPLNVNLGVVYSQSDTKEKKPAKEPVTVVPASDSDAGDDEQESGQEEVVVVVEEKETPKDPKTPKKKRATPGQVHSKSTRRVGPYKIKPSKDDLIVPATSSPVKPSPVTPHRFYTANRSPSRKSSACSASPEEDACSGDFDSEGACVPILQYGRSKSTRSSPMKSKGQNVSKTYSPSIPRASSVQHIATPVSERRGSRDSDLETDDSPAIPLSKLMKDRKREPEVDEETEIADDTTDMHDDRDNVADEGPQTRKRKRAMTASASKSGYKTVARRSVKRQRTSTPPQSLSTSTPATHAQEKGTRVLAYYSHNNKYYPAWVHAISGSRAHVKYFDDDEDTSVAISKLYRLELQIDDTICYQPKGNYQAVVVDISDLKSKDEIRIRFMDGPKRGDYGTVSMRDIHIPSRVVQSQWKDRVIDELEIMPATGRKHSRGTPSPSKASMLSRSPSRQMGNRDIVNTALERYGFVITLSVGDNRAKDKEALEATITRLGGVVLEDWSKLFSLDGKHSGKGNKQWSLNSKDVKYAPSRDPKIANAIDSVERIFLISDKENKKPRYLLALALGIPCVSADWLEEVRKDGTEALESWPRYLLPAGSSETLETRVSQIVDLEWGTAVEHLTEITDNKVPTRVLKGLHVLCVGPDLFPQPPAKKNTGDITNKLEASRVVPRIAVAMGARRVEAVANANSASRSLEDYDYVLIKEGSSIPQVRGVNGNVTWVNTAWLKECLITGRLIEDFEIG